MQKSTILYEPLNITRLGLLKDNPDMLIIEEDYSGFAFMLEEYISYGAAEIVMPKSAPEVAHLDQMPKIINERVKLIDDQDEIEISRKLLYKLRKEFRVEISKENNQLDFSNTPPELIDSINHVHECVEKLSLGFNKQIQISLNPQFSINKFKHLRSHSSNQNTRLVLAQFEALLNTYKDVEFNAPTPPSDTTPPEIISMFDQLINDPDYLAYSDKIQKLSFGESYEKAKVELRKTEKMVKSNNYITEGWNYLTKIIKIFSGYPLPDSSTLSNIFKGRTLPSLVNMGQARANALEIWKKSNSTQSPLNEDGTYNNDESIYWLPLKDSMFVSSEDTRGISIPFKDVQEAVEKAQKQIENEN